MCKTAFSILVERTVKFAQSQGCRLEIYFEGAGRKEDDDIGDYARQLKRHGMPFNETTSVGYGALQADDFKQVLLGEPSRLTKKSPMIQLADLILYPIAKAGYDAEYPPYRLLRDHEKLIDAHVPTAARGLLGVKYSCFDIPKRQDPALAGP